MAAKKNLPTFKSASDGQVGQCRLFEPALLLEPMNDKNAAERMLDWISSATDQVAEKSLQKITNDDAVKKFLLAVFDLSPYLADLAKQFPKVVVDCSEVGFSKTFEQARSIFEITDQEADEASVVKAIRIFKKKAALICGLADLGGWWSWSMVSQTISETADSTVSSAVRFLLHQANSEGKLNLPDEKQPDINSGYTVLAMGKHGASELNYSSDIDLIVFFDPDAGSIVDRDESVKLFVRLTKRLIKIMQDRTEDGYGFRTDLRLRPDPGSMPLAIPLPVAINYYESRGQNWERAALIKARPVAGDIALGDQILEELSPFIWRRYLDFAAIADVHSIKRQIQTHRGYSDLAIPGHNVKLGRGGIREIEFFVQTQQLIAGGRNPQLRGMQTIEMLNALAEHQWIERSTATDLSVGYAFLRDLEHRLQMIFDDQTHLIPEQKDELARVICLCGERSVKEFQQKVLIHLKSVEAHYAALFAAEDVLTTGSGNLSFTGNDPDPGTIETLSALGFDEPERVVEIVRGWHYGRYAAMQSEKSRERLTELTPSLLVAFAETGKGDDTLLAFDKFLKGLPSGMQFFSILAANKKLLKLLVLVLSAAPRLTNIITRRPHIFDGVLEPGFFDIKPDVAVWSQVLQRSLDQSRDYEDGLDRVRIFAAEQKFLVGIRLLSGAVTPESAGKLFADLAEMLLMAMVDWVEKDFVTKHGRVPGAEFAVVGLGNLGTRELTAGSDLDLMLLYRFDPEQDESDGLKKLHASQYFGRLAQRLISAMGAPTSQGVVYELDFRLRPHGAAGPIATSLRAFEKYYSESAWTWEKLALTRARVLGEPTQFSAEIEDSIRSVLKTNKNISQISADVLEMRKLMDEERPPKDLWDIKLAKGGMIDIDFLNQTDTLIKLKDGSTEEIDLSSNDILCKARADYFSIIHLLRLSLERDMSFQDAPERLFALILSHLELPDIKSAEGYLKQTQKTVREIFLARMKELNRLGGG